MTRQILRAETRSLAKHERYEITGHGKKVGTGRLNKWLQRHPKLAPFYNMALSILGGRPSWRATRKMMAVLATAPKVRPILSSPQTVPYVAMLGRHERGSWRSFPHIVIDANLKVTK